MNYFLICAGLCANAAFAFSPEAGARAQAQLRAMLNSRPAMLRYDGVAVDEQSILFYKALNLFSGAGTGLQIDWDPSPPASAGRAEHWLSRDGRGARIRIRDAADGRSAGEFAEMWFSFYFEMTNLRRHHAFREIFDSARSHHIDRDSFIRRCAQLEYFAWIDMLEVRDKIWLGWANARGVSPPPSSWDVLAPILFNAWLLLMSPDSGYPDKHYGAIYDRLRGAQQASASARDALGIPLSGGIQAAEQPSAPKLVIAGNR